MRSWFQNNPSQYDIIRRGLGPSRLASLDRRPVTKPQVSGSSPRWRDWKGKLLAIQMWVFLSSAKFQQVLPTLTRDWAVHDPCL